jgi:hypothetical protein
MKRWIAGHLLSADDLYLDETFPISDKEFYISLSMVLAALGAFTILIYIFGS